MILSVVTATALSLLLPTSLTVTLYNPEFFTAAVPSPPVSKTLALASASEEDESAILAYSYLNE